MPKCSVVKQNIGYSKCNDLPKVLRGMMTTPMSFKATAEEAADPAFWQDAINAGKAQRAYKWPGFIQNDDAKTDATYEENVLGTRLADPGKYQWRAYFAQDMCTHKAIQTHSGNARVIFFDGTQFFLMEDEDGNVMGFPAYIQAEKMIIGDGSVTTKTPVFVSLLNSYDVDSYGVTLPAPFYGNLLPLTDVILKVVGTPTVDNIIIDVAARCDGTEIEGLLMADFQVRNVAGVLQPLTSAAPVADVPGRYNLAGTVDFVPGTVNLRSAAALTITGYESTGPVTFTV